LTETWQGEAKAFGTRDLRGSTTSTCGPTGSGLPPVRLTLRVGG
jgi:hypothetical protein